MTFISQSAGRRAVPGANRRLRGHALKDATATMAFFLAVGFSAALVFGLLGH